MEPLKGYLDAPLTSAGVDYSISLGYPPYFSIITFFDGERMIGSFSLDLYFEKDLDVFARHVLRFLRSYYLEIYRTEERERQKDLDRMQNEGR